MTLLEQFWAKFCRKNPGFGQADDTKVTLTIGSLRKIVKQAHHDGFHGGLQTAKSLEGLGKHDPSGDAFQDIMDILKGKGK